MARLHRIRLLLGDENINRIYYGDTLEKALKDSVYYMEVELDDTY